MRRIKNTYLVIAKAILLTIDVRRLAFFERAIWMMGFQIKERKREFGAGVEGFFFSDRGRESLQTRETTT